MTVGLPPAFARKDTQLLASRPSSLGTENGSDHITISMLGFFLHFHIFVCMVFIFVLPFLFLIGEAVGDTLYFSICALSFNCIFCLPFKDCL